ncbi:hypothetical protein [Hoeflea sp. TYP-13]|uniref:hypothetical protein n=1 Tax=Hoeflea sp. TYP-13 TaxID=3230023 RepID=UPI0034C6C22C
MTEQQNGLDYEYYNERVNQARVHRARAIRVLMKSLWPHRPKTSQPKPLAPAASGLNVR